MYDSCRDDDLMDVVGQMHGIMCAASRQLLAAVVELDQREAWKVDAAASMVDWLVLRLGVSHSTARSWLRVARGLVYTPTVADLYEAGHLSWDQVGACVDLVAFGGEDEAVVATDAVGRTAAELDRLAREAKRVSREESLTRRDDEYARLRWDRNGMLRLHGRFADERGKAIERAIQRIVDTVVADRDASGGLRPYDQRVADAVHAMASNVIAEDADPDLATVIIHTDAHALTEGNDALDLASIELGPVISMATVHRLACDGRCQVVVDDLFGRTIDVAKTVHAVPRWLRRRVLHRDGACRWTGCRRTALLHAHHIRWWTRDRGPTIEDNLVALCWFHHHAVHEGGWEIHGSPRGRLTFTGPRGQRLQAGPPGLRGDIRDELNLAWTSDPPPAAA